LIQFFRTNKTKTRAISSSNYYVIYDASYCASFFSSSLWPNKTRELFQVVKSIRLPCIYICISIYVYIYIYIYIHIGPRCIPWDWDLLASRLTPVRPRPHLCEAAPSLSLSFKVLGPTVKIYRTAVPTHRVAKLSSYRRTISLMRTRGRVLGSLVTRECHREKRSEEKKKSCYNEPRANKHLDMSRISRVSQSWKRNRSLSCPILKIIYIERIKYSKKKQITNFVHE